MSTVASSGMELAHLGTVRAQSGDTGYRNDLALAWTRGPESDAAIESGHRASALVARRCANLRAPPWNRSATEIQIPCLETG